MRKLTDAQMAVLQAMPKAERSRFWGHGPAGLSISARTACLRKNLIRLSVSGAVPTFLLTDAGRAALSQPTPTTEDKGREDRAS